jgi:hypothetical protein
MRPRLAVSTALVLLAAALAAAALPPEVDRALRESKFVYIQSERKSGELGKAAEIWFYYDGKSVYVGTRPTSWRVRRIKAKRAKARIAVGKQDGPAFQAKGELVHDAAVEEKLMAEYAHKYPDGWSKFADAFREGFKSGDRVLVRYTPAS